MKKIFSFSSLLSLIPANKGYLRIRVFQFKKFRFVLTTNPVESLYQTHRLTLYYNGGAGSKKGFSAWIIFPTAQSLRVLKRIKTATWHNKKTPNLAGCTKNANVFYPV